MKEFSKNVFKNDIALRNGQDSYELPVPATYVIDRTDVIRFAHVNVDYMTGRAEHRRSSARFRRLRVVWRNSVCHVSDLHHHGNVPSFA